MDGLERLLIRCLIWLVCVFQICPWVVGQFETRDAQALEIASPARIDGVLDEPFWANAVPVSGFRMEEPDNGKPASERTEVRIAFTKDTIFFGIKAFDSEPEKISQRLQRRDIDFNSDWVVIYLDPNRDQRTGYAFRINPAGVEVDSILFDDVRADSNWDAVWDSATGLFDGGWTAELAIPFSQLRLPRAGASVWGFNVERAIDRKAEISFWVYRPRTSSGRVSRFGTLSGLNEIQSSKRLELLPYVLGSYTSAPDGTSTDTEVGADLNYRIGKSFTLDATINPDFGQVEADPSELNLTVFETFFPERRLFFLRGSEIFETRVRQFFSRRIGRQPGFLDPAPGDTVLSTPEQTRILGAAKMTGRTEGGTTIGLIAASTDEAFARVRTSDGEERDQLIEPRTEYLVGRVKQDILGGDGYVGGLATGVLRDGADNAQTASMDWEFYFGDRKWITRGQAIGSKTGSGDEEARGWGVDLSLDSVGYKHWEHELDVDLYSDELSLNDLGFLRRNDLQEAGYALTWQNPDPHGPFLSRGLRGYVFYRANTDGDELRRFLWARKFMEFRNNWSLGLELSHAFAAFDDRETRGGPLVRDDGATEFELELESDGSRQISFEFEYEYNDSKDGGNQHELGIEMVYYPKPELQLLLGGSYSTRLDKSQWVANVEDDTGTHYLFGELDADVLDVTFRMNWTFTPVMSLQVYAQPFLAAGEYTNFRELAEPRTSRYTPFPYAENEDFNIGEFTLNAVFRWEWSPGSLLFVVWNEGRESFSDLDPFDPLDDYDRLFGEPATDVFLIKFTKWFNW